MARVKQGEGPKAPKGWTEQGGNVNQMEADETVDGIYLGITPARNDESSPVARFQLEDGSIVRYWAPTILESKLSDVEGGTRVLVRCLGKTRPIKSRKGTMAWDYQVFTRDGE